jgi:hypothetical protein
MMKEIIECLVMLMVAILIATFPLSLINVFAVSNSESPCDTKGYYLPATYIICTLNEKREK